MCAAELPFFDPSKARGPRKGPDVGEDVTAEIVAGAAGGPMSVSALVARVKLALTEAFPQRVAVVGEISNLKSHTSGHLYFRLKDAGAAIDAAMFRSSAGRLKFELHDGMEVVAEGRVDVYESRGQLQFYVEKLTPKGAGALELAFRQLREKLQREGLFDPAHKVPLPRFPQAIGVVTSPTGAAIRDIGRTLRRRCPSCPVYLMPALVQGEGAAESVAQAIRLLDAGARKVQIDTIIVARGGGSLEDLWAFNEEVVARAIYAARTPIISGVGHEVDVTIADLVADVRAPTPTGAAELAVPDTAELRRHIAHLAGRLARRAKDVLRASQAALQSVLRSVVFRDPAFRLRSAIQHVDELSQRLTAALNKRLAGQRGRLEPVANRLAALHPARLAERAKATLNALTHRLAWVLGARSKRAGDALAAVETGLQQAHPRHRFALARQRLLALERQLESMSYRSVLGRGFSMTRDAQGKIIRSVAAVNPGDAIETELADGKIASRVEDSTGKSSLQTNLKDRENKPRGKPQAQPQGGMKGLFD